MFISNKSGLDLDLKSQTIELLRAAILRVKKLQKKMILFPETQNELHSVQISLKTTITEITKTKNYKFIKLENKHRQNCFYADALYYNKMQKDGWCKIVMGKIIN